MTKPTTIKKKKVSQKKKKKKEKAGKMSSRGDLLSQLSKVPRAGKTKIQVQA